MFELDQQTEQWWKQLLQNIGVYPINCPTCDYNVLISRNYSVKQNQALQQVVCPHCLNTMQVSSSNLRKSARYLHKQTLKLIQAPYETNAISIDLSNAGVQLLCETQLDHKLPVEISCEAFSARAKIAWHKTIKHQNGEALFNYGVQFLDFKPNGTPTFISIKT